MRRLFLLLLPMLALLLTQSPALAAPTKDAEPEKSPVAVVQNAWDALLETNMKALADVRAQAKDLQDRLSELAAPLSAELPEIEAEFQQLSAIAQISRSMPGELTVVAERSRRLLEQLDTLTSPLGDTMADLSERLDDLAGLETDATEPANEALSEFRTLLAATKRQITQVQSRITIAMAPANSLRSQIGELQARMEDSMPTLWRNYYLAPHGKIFDPESWNAELGRIQSVRQILSLRMSTELPQSRAEWLLVLVRVLVPMLPLSMLLYLSRKPAARAPSMIRDGWLRILSNSAVWLILGLSLHFAAWSNGKMFQIVASIGTIILCWGQMALAWDLRSFDLPHRERVSPLWPMFLPMLVGMTLLYFDPYPLFLAALWVVAQCLTLWRQHKRTPNDDKLTRTLLQGFSVVTWLTLLLTLFGFARLSILLCMGYTALAVCIQQGLAILHVGNQLQQFLPKEGPRALTSSLLLALVIPLVLLIASMVPMLWILAYPGGAYLLQHVASLGFNVGELSFNAMQVVSIFIAFYVTRSLITVGSTFITSMREQRTALSSSLIGPFQTAYTYILWAFFGLYVLSSLGFSLTSLTIVAGGLSVGVGFGMQNIVQNFISGLMVIFGQVIREGDIVEVSGVTGTVKRVNIRSTLVETFENATVFIPNSQFLSNTFTNWTHNDLTVRQEINVGVAYGSDLPLCIQLLGQIATEHTQVMRYPAPSVNFTDFAASSLNLMLRFWIANYDQGLTINTEIRLRINELFAQNNIEISFPQLDVHIRDQSVPAETAANAPVTVEPAQSA